MHFSCIRHMHSHIYNLDVIPNQETQVHDFRAGRLGPAADTYHTTLSPHTHTRRLSKNSLAKRLSESSSRVGVRFKLLM